MPLFRKVIDADGVLIHAMTLFFDERPAVVRHEIHDQVGMNVHTSQIDFYKRISLFSDERCICAKEGKHQMILTYAYLYFEMEGAHVPKKASIR